MHRDLTEAEMDDVLARQLYGHLGCTMSDHRVYVVPLTYAYHEGAIYGFSFPGLKIDALRQSPSACFQTEQFLSEGVWRSVIAWGNYEEIPDEGQTDAITILCRRLQREQGTATTAFYEMMPGGMFASGVLRVLKEDHPIFFRMRIERKTGRYVRN